MKTFSNEKNELPIFFDFMDIFSEKHFIKVNLKLTKWFLIEERIKHSPRQISKMDFLWKLFTAFSQYFSTKLHLRRLTWFWIHLWRWMRVTIIIGDSWNYMPPILVPSSAKRIAIHILVIAKLNGRKFLILRGFVCDTIRLSKELPVQS